jgi:hypothetical protein
MTSRPLWSGRPSKATGRRDASTTWGMLPPLLNVGTMGTSSSAQPTIRRGLVPTGDQETGARQGCWAHELRHDFAPVLSGRDGATVQPAPERPGAIHRLGIISAGWWTGSPVRRDEREPIEQESGPVHVRPCTALSERLRAAVPNAFKVAPTGSDAHMPRIISATSTTYSIPAAPPNASGGRTATTLPVWLNGASPCVGPDAIRHPLTKMA